MNLLDIIQHKRDSTKKAGTAKNLTVLKNFVELFLLKKYKKKNIPLSKIDQTFWKEFQEFSIKEEHSHNYIGVHIAMINGILNSISDTVSVIHMKKIDSLQVVRSRHKPLTREQIKKLLTFKESESGSLLSIEVGRERMKCRDLVLFQCETGISYDDLVHLGRRSVLETEDGPLLQYKRRKTGVNASIPLSEIGHGILQKYNYNFKIEYWRYHRRLGEIGKALGFKLSSHMGRHTFGTFKVEDGWQLNYIQHMMAHSSIKSTQIYTEITPRALFAVQKRLSNHDYLNEKKTIF